jgi:hypothetical protein
MEAALTIVEPVPDELLRYRVRSRSGGPWRFVDLAAFNGNGSCDCPAFRIHGRRRMKERKALGFDEPTRCWHIQIARDYLIDELIRKMLADGKVHDDAKQPA